MPGRENVPGILFEARARYGSAARYSYWQGCSAGGRQGQWRRSLPPFILNGWQLGAALRCLHSDLSLFPSVSYEYGNAAELQQ